MNNTTSSFIIFTFALLSVAIPLSVLSSEPKAKAEVHSHEEDEREHEHSSSEEEGQHAHQHDEADVKESDDAEHEGEHSHGDHGDEHENGREEEGGSAIGPEKGITEFDEERGFKLSPEATKNFGIKAINAQAGQVLTLPRDAIFFGLTERNLFRLRDGFFKRIDFTTLSKSKTHFVVKVPGLKPGDQIVTEGIGFLRIAELAATGGVAHGHSH